MATLTPTAKRIVSLARLAGYEVRVRERNGSMHVLAKRHGDIGLVRFWACWPTGSAAAWVILSHVGWHEWPSTVTELEASLVGEVYRLRAPAA